MDIKTSDFGICLHPVLSSIEVFVSQGKAVYSLLLSMISMGKQREFWERRWLSPLAEFLTGSHIIIIKCLKLFDDLVSLGFRLGNV